MYRKRPWAAELNLNFFTWVLVKPRQVRQLYLDPISSTFKISIFCDSLVFFAACIRVETSLSWSVASLNWVYSLFSIYIDLDCGKNIVLVFEQISCDSICC